MPLKYDLVTTVDGADYLLVGLKDSFPFSDLHSRPHSSLTVLQTWKTVCATADSYFSSPLKLRQ